MYQASRGYDDSDSVLDLSPSMRLLQYFAPASWAANNSRDLDMSAEPALLPGGQVLIAGKSRIAYLLNGAHLGGIGGQLASLRPVCSANIDGGRGGDRPHRVPALCQRDRWRSGATRVPAGPAAAVEFPDRRRAADRGRGPGLDDQPGRVPCTASTRRPGTSGSRPPSASPANHFPTPSVGAGLLLAPAANRVVAFRVAGTGASPGQHRPVSTAPSARHSQQDAASIAPSAGLSGGAIAGIVIGSLAVLTGLGWLVWRRVPNRPGG